MIEFNPNNKTNKVNFTANLKGEEIVKPVENFLSQMIEHVKKSITDSRIASKFEILQDNPSAYQEVAKYGFRIRPKEGAANSDIRILEKVAEKRGEGKKVYEYFTEGSLKEILEKLQTPNLMDEMDDFIKRMNKQLFLD